MGASNRGPWRRRLPPLRSERVAEWASERVSRRERVCWTRTAHGARARKLEPAERASPGSSTSLLHSFAHVLMRELALECGYSAASIRERIYASLPAIRSRWLECCLYGRSRQRGDARRARGARPSRRSSGDWSTRALDRARLCASDPLCSEHDPQPTAPCMAPPATRVYSRPRPRARSGTDTSTGPVVPTFRLADAALVPAQARERPSPELLDHLAVMGAELAPATARDIGRQVAKLAGAAEAHTLSAGAPGSGYCCAPG